MGRLRPITIRSFRLFPPALPRGSAHLFPYSVATQRAGGMSLNGRIYAKIVRRGTDARPGWGGWFTTDCFKLDVFRESADARALLGRIGLAWSIAAVLYLNFGVKTRAAIAVAVLAVRSAFGAGRGARRRRRRAADLRGESGRLISTAVLPGKLIYGSFDPEGSAQHGAAVGDSHVGMFTGEFVRRGDIRGGRKTLWMAAAAAGVLAAGLPSAGCCREQETVVEHLRMRRGSLLLGMFACFTT